MGDETVNGANTGVFGRFMACGWGCVGYDKGRGKEWGLNGVEAEKTKRLHGFNFGLRGGLDEAWMMGG